MARFEFTDLSRSLNAAFLGDFGDREHILAGGVKLAGAFTTEGEYVVQANGAAAAGATSLTVDALPVAIPSGTELRFGNVVAVVGADAAAGATSLTVGALGGAVADNAQAIYDAEGSNVLPAGSLVGRTFAEQAAGDPFGAAADADDEVFFTLRDVDLDETDEVELVRHGTLIKINFVPNWDGVSSALKAKVRASYQTILG